MMVSDTFLYWNYADGMAKPLSEIKFKLVRSMCETPRTSQHDKAVQAEDSVFMMIFDSVDQEM